MPPDEKNSFVVARKDLVEGLRTVAAERPDLHIQVVVVPRADAPPPPPRTS